MPAHRRYEITQREHGSTPRINVKGPLGRQSLQSWSDFAAAMVFPVTAVWLLAAEVICTWNTFERQASSKAGIEGFLSLKPGLQKNLRGIPVMCGGERRQAVR